MPNSHTARTYHRATTCGANIGFTLVELLVTIAVAIVLITVAVPSFNNLMRDMRVHTAVNAFLASVHFARSEAARRGVRVAVCPSSDQQQCERGANFDDGWLVVAGPDPYAATAPVLRSFAPDMGGIDIQFRFGAAADPYLSYIPTGQARTDSGALMMGSVRFCEEGSDHRIIINATGRPRVAEQACTT